MGDRHMLWGWSKVRKQVTLSKKEYNPTHFDATSVTHEFLLLFVEFISALSEEKLTHRSVLVRFLHPSRPGGPG